MKTLAEYQQLVEAEIKKQFFDKKTQPKELFEPIEYILEEGGKRLRPALCVLACHLFSEQIAQAVKPAVALETFHNFTLLHDDIMDKADMRRGRATVHKKWNENTAILSGDAMVILAYQLLEEIDSKYLSQVLKIFNQTSLDVCIGQQYDMNFELRPLGTQTEAVSESEYLYMISKKTSVLIAASLQIGAILGGAKSSDAQNLYDFGENLGIAFQLQDDLLDVYGNEAEFGKKIGGDILANKKTFLLIKAYELLHSKEQLNEMIYFLPQSEKEKQYKILKVTEIYNSLEIKELTEQKILFFYHKALQALDTIEIEEFKKKILKDFAMNLLNRKK